MYLHSAVLPMYWCLGATKGYAGGASHNGVFSDSET